MGTRHELRSARDGNVYCIACGDVVDRSAAREYDKHGDRFDRDGKQFEWLCKPCHKEHTHLPRDGLEETLVAAGAGTTDDETFLRQYLSIAETN